MQTTNFGKQEFIELFHEIGVGEEASRRWHATFEKRWPEDHRRFLEWLKIPAAEVERIRESSRTTWARP
ncbi:MAG: hypothetical protein HYY06_21470 [Deltaproteobacteria bacterium]|nr:hypothetical protein [Deltaproteobacteria bacterium]